MKEIMEQYGGIIITLVAVIALIGIIVFLMKTDGFIANAFQDVINTFFSAATDKIGITPVE